MPISPLQGRLLQFLAVACRVRTILEIGSLAGYSGIWLARALPPDGRLITLEIDPFRVALSRRSFVQAGVADRAEVREGKALELLPQLVQEAPFDLVFIDANKSDCLDYLEWALRLSRAGSHYAPITGLARVASRIPSSQEGSDQTPWIKTSSSQGFVPDPHRGV